LDDDPHRQSLAVDQHKFAIPAMYALSQSLY